MGCAKTARGSNSLHPCTCSKQAREDSLASERFLRVLGLRFSLWELPKPESFTSYLQSLLHSSPCPYPFPRVLKRWGSDGFPILARLGRRDRWCFAATLNSFKRGLRPANCKAHSINDREAFLKWSANSCRALPPSSDPSFLAFCARKCRSLFRPGWDRSYDSFVDSFVPSESARYDRKENSLNFWNSRCSYSQFKSYLKGAPCDFLQGPKLRFKAVKTAGKVRPLGLPTADWDLLGPLHKTLYQFLSQQRWLLKGPPNASAIRSLCRFEWQTSVDLVSATDNLCQDVVNVILGAASATSVVHPRLFEMAHTYQSPVCRGLTVNHGQMMGTYLSFPLLCIQSWLAAEWACRGVKHSVLINGDDCLISAERRIDPSMYPRGFIVNKEKTVVSRFVAEINSTQFVKRRGRFEEVRFLRRGAFYADNEGVVHFAAACVKAGPSWTSPFFRAGLSKRVLPSHLGFRDVDESAQHCQRLLLKGRYSVVVASKPPPTRFLLSEEEPSYGDRFGFHMDLFEFGRGKCPQKAVVFKSRAPKRIKCLARFASPVPRSSEVFFFSEIYNAWRSSVLSKIDYDGTIIFNHTESSYIDDLEVGSCLLPLKGSLY